MADKKKGKQRKVEEEKPTKEEYAVAKFLRFSLPTREGKLHGMEVKCFMGNAAVDKLLESKWSAAKNKKDPIFTNRAVCVAYMLRLLEKGLFHRAEREKRKKDKDKEKPRKKKNDRDGEKDEATNPDEELRERKGKKDKKSRKEKEGEGNAEDAEKKESSEKKEKKEEKKKKEKRLKLVMPDQQFFEDGDEVYVWIYDPVNAKTFLIGLLMVLGAIGLCMFPLWPEEVRIGVYYLSLAAAGFVGFILSLVVLRLILFCCIWVLTLGRHHFWLLPNLTEDVGFFDSFRPLYKHDAMLPEEPKSKESKKKKKMKEEEGEDKGEGSAEDAAKKGKSSDRDDSDEFEVIKKEDIDDNDDGDEEVNDINDEDMEEGNDFEGENDMEEEEDEDDDNNEDENLDTEEEEEDADEVKKTK